VSEGAAVGTAVGLTATSNDPNAGATYSLSDNANGAFTIDATSGVVAVADPTKIDYGTAPGHAQTITVKADDGQGFTTKTFSIAITPVAMTPSVIDSATNEDAQSSSGLVISRNSEDGPEVKNFKITAISGGALYLNDGITLVHDGEFITAEAGAAGLKFTPSAGSVSSGHFTVQASTTADDKGLGGEPVVATITVSPRPSTEPVTSTITKIAVDTPAEQIAITPSFLPVFSAGHGVVSSRSSQTSFSGDVFSWTPNIATLPGTPGSLEPISTGFIAGSLPPGSANDQIDGERNSTVSVLTSLRLQSLVNGSPLAIADASTVFSQMNPTEVIAAIRGSGLAEADAMAVLLSRIARGENVSTAQLQQILVTRGINANVVKVYVAAFQIVRGAPATQRAATATRR